MGEFMKGISASSVRSVNFMGELECSDNTGAKVVYIIGVFGQKTRAKQQPAAGIADMVNVVVRKGKPEVKKKTFRAVLVRTKKGIKRANGIRVKFDSNAAVIVDNDGVPKATEIKGSVPKEVGERWPKVVGLASVIV